MRKIICAKLKKEAIGLDYPPSVGDLGIRIYREISQEAWKMWLNHSVMFINENRLNPAELPAQQRLRFELEQFLFGAGSAPPAGYTPPPAATQ